MTELEALRARVQAQGRMIAVLQDALSTALSAMAQATVPSDGFNEAIRYGPHSRTHLMSMSLALSAPEEAAEPPSIAAAARKYADAHTTGEAGVAANPHYDRAPGAAA